jgi:hypothetical protein
MRGTGRGSSRRLVEEKDAAVVQYMQHHILEILENIGCFDPQHPDALRFQPRIPALVLRDLAGMVVTAPVHLDREPSGDAVEIRHIGSDGMLPSKLHTLWARAQPLP